MLEPEPGRPADGRSDCLSWDVDWGIGSHCQKAVELLAARPCRTTIEPERPERCSGAQSVGDAPSGTEPLEHRPQIGQFDFDAADPDGLLAALQPRARLDGKPNKRVGMARLRLRPFAGAVEVIEGEPPNGLQQPVARGSVSLVGRLDEMEVDEVGQRINQRIVDGITPHRIHHPERPATVEHGDLAQQPLGRRRKQVVAPADRLAQTAVVGRSVGGSAAEDVAAR